MKSNKAQIQAKYHRISMIRFQDQKLTSFSGLLLFQVLFGRIKLKQGLKKCFTHLKVFPIFGRHLVVLLIIVHLLLGFRRLREVDYYRDGPIVLSCDGDCVSYLTVPQFRELFHRWKMMASKRFESRLVHGLSMDLNERIYRV